MKKQIATVVSELLNVDKNLIEVQTPSNVYFGDFSIPCFAFAKVLRKSPQNIAQFLVDHFSIEDVETLQGKFITPQTVLNVNSSESKEESLSEQNALTLKSY